MPIKTYDVVIVGTGIIGISTAYYLKKFKPNVSVLLIDAVHAMTLTSAQSGENYRNWWPHPVMTQFTDRSIDLMEEISELTTNRINLTRRGYVLATRNSDPAQLLSELQFGYSHAPSDSIRLHQSSVSGSYISAKNSCWKTAPDGVDIINNAPLIKQLFPSYANDIATLVHVRRAGSVDSQQMGQFMLESFKNAGGERLLACVESIRANPGNTRTGFSFSLTHNALEVQSANCVNAAGPFINDIAKMLGCQLPVTHTLQQKIAFEDTQKIIPRNLPFSIDLDNQRIEWTEEERALLLQDSAYASYTEEMMGSIHCRPDGGDLGSWVKLGWAFNTDPSEPSRNPRLRDEFPDIVLRGAARLNPRLEAYIGKLPRSTRHYGGFYTLTEENWPLIGAMDIEGAFVVGAMSGFGTMAACASGELCAQWVLGLNKLDYAKFLSPQRYNDKVLMKEVLDLSSRGIL